jgi:hypothetical protein
MQVRLEKNAVKIVKAFGERQKIKTLSNAQRVNALIEEYEATRPHKAIQDFTLNPQPK